MCSLTQDKDFLDVGISTGSYIYIYQGVTINHCTHIPGTDHPYSAQIEYNTACTAGMDLAHFRMLNN